MLITHDLIYAASTYDFAVNIVMVIKHSYELKSCHKILILLKKKLFHAKYKHDQSCPFHLSGILPRTKHLCLLWNFDMNK